MLRRGFVFNFQCNVDKCENVRMVVKALVSWRHRKPAVQITSAHENTKKPAHFRGVVVVK